VPASTEAWYIPFLSSIPSGFVGAAVVYYFGLRQRAKERRFAYLDRQLTEFYAPLAGLRKQIRAKSELRLKVSNATDLAAERSEATLDYHNKQFTEELLPKYRQMLALFTEKYHLADADTRAFYQQFLEYVEIWNMWLAEALERDIPTKLGHSESNLKPFYEHLDCKMQQLQNEISRG
jgi:hypothetical protein